MYGIDLSNWQKGIDLSKANFDFAIIKATEGISYIDPCFSEFAVQLTELDKLIGCYHFARPDSRPNVAGMEAEAKFFVETVRSQGLLGNAILVLDWETEPINRPDLIKAWINKVQDLTDVTPFIYASKSTLVSLSADIKGIPLWMASWPSIQKVNFGEMPYSTPDKTVDWCIWQYSSTGQFPGYNGNVDLNYFDRSKEFWNWNASIDKTGAGQENLSDEMKWCIEKNIFVGYPDGTFRPKNSITREEVAAVLKRFNEYILNGIFG